MDLKIWSKTFKPATPRDQLGLPPATAPPAILIQKSPPAGGTSTSLASSSATATPIYTATPVAKVQAAPPPLVEETPPPQAPRPPTPTAEELRQAELETDKANGSSKS